MNRSEKKRVDRPAGKVFIGTSNIVLQITKAKFPTPFQQYSRLQYYATIFNSLEVNASFYKVPQRKTFEKWGDDCPGDFRFSVKAWKDITHVKPAAIDVKKIDAFMNAANGLPPAKRGCILLQFPASFTPDKIDLLKAGLRAIKRHNKSQPWTIAVELRSKEWYGEALYKLLEAYSCTLVLHDMPASALQEIPVKTNTVYIRFHGVKGDYRGTYSTEILSAFAKKILQWKKQGKDVYVYFNNTLGEAYNNAATLQQMVTTAANG